MALFQSLLILLVCAVALAALARYLKLPYPSLLALGGTVLAFFPHAHTFALDRTLTRVWRACVTLVVVAVGITTVAVAWLLRQMVPEMPWAAAIAIGAIVAPPDAVAGSALIR